MRSRKNSILKVISRFLSILLAEKSSGRRVFVLNDVSRILKIPSLNAKSQIYATLDRASTLVVNKACILQNH